MKKTALAIAFAVATLPLTFAAQAPAAQTPASGQPTTESTKKPVKKHVKKTKKSETTESSAVSK